MTKTVIAVVDDMFFASKIRATAEALGVNVSFPRSKEAVIEKLTQEAGIGRRAIDADEIVDRTIYALVNEGAKILEEGFALRAVDIDIIYLTGYGFPVYRGGPMWYADTVGLQKVYDRICEFEARHGKLWKPAPLLKRLAAQGGTFAKWEKSL